MLSLRRITDPDCLLCHRCGLPLRGGAHKECAEATLMKTKQTGKKPSKIKHARSARPYEGIGTIGHTPCRLDNGSLIIPAEEARKIREEGFVSNQTGVRFGPWTNGRLRERSRVQNRENAEEVTEETEEITLDDWDLFEDKDDLFSLANGYPVKMLFSRMFLSDLNVPTEVDKQQL